MEAKSFKIQENREEKMYVLRGLFRVSTVMGERGWEDRIQTSPRYSKGPNLLIRLIFPWTKSEFVKAQRIMIMITQ